MKAIAARIQIYQIDENDLPVHANRFITVHGDDHLVHLEIDGKKFGVIARDLTQAIARCEGWK